MCNSEINMIDREALLKRLEDAQGDYWIWTGMHAAAFADEDIAWIEAEQAILNDKIRELRIALGEA